MSRKIDLNGFGILLVMLVMLCVVTVIISVLGETVIGYEYETVDGETGVAEYCDTPYRSVPYCLLDDGTRVYSIKKYKTMRNKEGE